MKLFRRKIDSSHNPHKPIRLLSRNNGMARTACTTKDRTSETPDRGSPITRSGEPRGTTPSLGNPRTAMSSGTFLRIFRTEVRWRSEARVDNGNEANEVMLTS